jgi:hypothetical protein
MRLFRVRLCSLLIAVAVVGLAAGLIGLCRRRNANFLRRANYHDSHISVNLDGGPTALGVDLHFNRSGKLIFETRYFGFANARDQAEYHRRILANQNWHVAMKRKYLRAAAMPWLLLEPDPPEPPFPDWDAMSLRPQARMPAAPQTVEP